MSGTAAGWLIALAWVLVVVLLTADSVRMLRDYRRTRAELERLQAEIDRVSELLERIAQDDGEEQR